MRYYFTAKEAMDYLGMNVGAFYYLIETGKIKRLTPPGKKQGFYSKHQIERLRHQNEDEEPGIAFMKATPADIHEEYELAALMLSSSARFDLPTYEAWLDKNPDTNFIVRDQGRLVAFMHVLPIKKDTVSRWMRGEIRGWEILTQDALAYTPGSSVTCIIMDMATTPDVDKQTRQLYGMRLIRGYLRFLYGLAEQDISVTLFCATSTTPDGIAFIKRAGFKETGRLGKRVVFELNPITANTRMAKAYRAALKREPCLSCGSREK